MRNAEYENTFGSQLQLWSKSRISFAVGISIFAARVNAIPSRGEGTRKGGINHSVIRTVLYIVLFRNIGY